MRIQIWTVINLEKLVSLQQIGLVMMKIRNDQ